LLRIAAAKKLEIRHYHAILLTLFHQTRSGPYTFARAAVNCAWRFARVKEYLLRHAEEERTHWRWILNDLRATGYQGPDPRSQPPHFWTQTLVGLMYYTAEEMPIARLASASVLEGIGAAHGETYGRTLVEQLGLQREQVTFFLSHGATDLVHASELRDLLADAELTPDEWDRMNHVASMTGRIYREMYSHESFADTIC
jgi:hypothetical protein